MGVCPILLGWRPQSWCGGGEVNRAGWAPYRPPCVWLAYHMGFKVWHGCLHGNIFFGGEAWDLCWGLIDNKLHHTLNTSAACYFAWNVQNPTLMIINSYFSSLWGSHFGTFYPCWDLLTRVGLRPHVNWPSIRHGRCYSFYFFLVKLLDLIDMWFGTMARIKQQTPQRHLSLRIKRYWNKHIFNF